ncbi:hypothetical protein C5167_012376 [Papaver somniferum]|uniref:Chromo domain-containing protein n=1 Tax=Papaver somniferum TaxID=3469 RepID=A0A4Y7J0E9_PAPSO|nr:probable chromo domain-containing protein LHP1 [Papaver somniferum]RZC53530.1 hypothetical protein C5167_012376 [Papaver somniferum]
MRGGRDRGRDRGRGGWSRRRIRGDDVEEEEEHHTSSGDAESESEEAAAIRLELEQNEQQGEDDDDEEEEEEFAEAEETMVVENSGNHTQEEVFVDAEVQEEEEEEEDEENYEEQLPPKLDEGFYEIEHVRRKRVRKGQAQYLIKWRGWPETANTWEPIENLQACVDVVDAFEESLQSGSKGRKRKRRGSFSQPKKTQQRTPSSNVSGSRPGRKPRSLTSPSTENSKPTPSAENSRPTPSAENSRPTPSTENLRPSTRRHRVASKSLYGEKKRNMTNEGEAKIVDGNSVGLVTQPTENQNELRQRTCTDNVNSDSGKVSIQFPDMRTSDKVESQRVELGRVDFDESIQSNRFTGARRRKSGNVKRFKKESAVSIVDKAQNGDKFEAHRVVDSEGLTRDGAADQRKVERLFNTSYITKIIKPIGYSASISNDVQDVCVSFVAMSSDGREVVVDNKKLKVEYPQMLISFYEQHLRYSPPAYPPA